PVAEVPVVGQGVAVQVDRGAAVETDGFPLSHELVASRIGARMTVDAPLAGRLDVGVVEPHVRTVLVGQYQPRVGPAVGGYAENEAVGAELFKARGPALLPWAGA